VRTKSIAAIFTIALFGAVAISVTGQEEPLPVVNPIVQPSIVLAVEPIVTFQAPTLVEAARNNDFASFDALYNEARQRGEDVSRFATLHELWTYAITDPIGAFYGTDVYDRLNRAYPGYAAYIADFRIVDNHGNAFYPTSETRRFLLDRALEGRAAPKVLVASDNQLIAPRPQRERRTASQAVPAPAPASVPAPAPVPIPVPVPAQDGLRGRPTSEPVVATVAAAPAQLPVAVAQTEPSPIPAPQPARSSRGILLIFAGLVGVGLLALILRTPGEKQPVTIIPRADHVADNVEPLRKTAEGPHDTTRADGTHG
jgi:hypothetical protein